MPKIVLEYESYGETWDSVITVSEEENTKAGCEVVLSDNGNGLPELYMEAYGEGDSQVLWEKSLGSALEEVIDNTMKAAHDVKNYDYVHACQKLYTFLMEMQLKPCGNYHNGKKG